MPEQTTEQTLELWFTHTNWVYVLSERNRARENAKKGGIPLFSGDARNITTREEGDYVVVHLSGFHPMNPDRPSIPAFIFLAADRAIDLRTNTVIKERGNVHAVQ